MYMGDFILELCKQSEALVDGKSETDFDVYRTTYRILAKLMRDMGKRKKCNTQLRFDASDGFSVLVRFGSEEGLYIVYRVSWHSTKVVAQHPYYYGVCPLSFDRYLGMRPKSICDNCGTIWYDKGDNHCEFCKASGTLTPFKRF